MSSRSELLDAAIDHVTSHGLGELSLRALATDIGTSHRMLIYHFGSRDGLLVELVRSVEQRQRERLAELSADDGCDPREQAARFWAQLLDPSMWPSERLFFELYGQALQGRPHAVALLDGVVESWLGPSAAMLERLGVARGESRAHARLGLAVVRGLLLDVLATGDVEGVRAAAAVYAGFYERG